VHQDEELHAQLMKLLREYFESNQQWMNEATYASSIRTRHLLSDIRTVCSARRKAVRLWQIEKRAQLDERKVRRAAQKGKDQGTENTN
jgi:hypothetical protein